VLLNLMLIPRFGINGAAVATTLTYIFNAVLIIGYSWRNLGISPFSNAIVKSVPIGFFSMLIIFTSEKYIFESIDGFLFIPIIIFFLILYSFSLLSLNGLEEQDVEILKSIETKTGLKIEFIRNFIKRFI
ncbi:hypothetical protein GOV14_04000, partial [Candidatus Pacearchaeota archaeon]|nr:hypothetical protein [Candidatus Pacearchaeota archaeon]